MAGRRSEVLAYHNAGRFQRGRGDGGKELGSEFCNEVADAGDNQGITLYFIWFFRISRSYSKSKLLEMELGNNLVRVYLVQLLEPGAKEGR